LKEGAAAFFMKSEKSFENNSSALIRAMKSVLASPGALAAASAQ